MIFPKYAVVKELGAHFGLRKKLSKESFSLVTSASIDFFNTANGESDDYSCFAHIVFRPAYWPLNVTRINCTTKL